MAMSMYEIGVPFPEHEIPHMVVLGGGNTQHGLEQGSRTNGSYAGHLIIAGVAPPDYLFTTGNGPVRGVEYPVSEAEGMADLVHDITVPHGVNPLIYAEVSSFDTMGNITGIAEKVEELGVDALSFIGAKGHAERACTVAQSVFGKKIEAVPVHSFEGVSLKGRVKEVGLSVLYQSVTLGHVSDRTALERRHEIYRAIVKLPKEVVSHAGLSGRYKSK